MRNYDNDAGVVVGFSVDTVILALILTNVVPEPSIWAMMLAGFAGLGLAGYCRAGAAQKAQEKAPREGGSEAGQECIPGASRGLRGR